MLMNDNTFHYSMQQNFQELFGNCKPQCLKTANSRQWMANICWADHCFFTSLLWLRKNERHWVTNLPHTDLCEG
jgi:hypothetical protein